MADETVNFTINVSGTQQLNQATQSVKGFTTTVNQADQTVKKMGGEDGGFKKAGKGVLALSYAMDDLQYGFRGVINNIPQLVMGFGMGAGLAGSIQLAAIAMNALTPGFFEFKTWIPEMVDDLLRMTNIDFSFSKLIGSMDDMVEKGIKANIAKGEEEFKKLKTAIPSEGVAKQMKAVTDAFKEMGGTEQWVNMYIDGLKKMGVATKQAQMMTADLFKKIFAGDPKALQELRSKYGQEFKYLIKETEQNLKLLEKIERDAGKFPGEGGARARELGPWRRQAAQISAKSSIDERIQAAMLEAEVLGDRPMIMDRRRRQFTDIRQQQINARQFIGQIDPRTGRPIRTPGQAEDLQKFFGMEKRVDEHLVKQTQKELVRRGVDAGEAAKLSRVMVGDIRKETDEALRDDSNRLQKEGNEIMLDLIGALKQSKAAMSIRRRGR